MSGETSFPVLMPQLGQAMVTGIIIEWHVADGSTVAEGAPLLTIESDKASFEIEAPATGTLRHSVAQGEAADVGTVIGHIGDAATLAAEAAIVAPVTAPAVQQVTASESPAPERIVATPKARMAAKGRIDLALITPSRTDGVIDIADVERALAAGDATDNEGTELPASRLHLIDRLVRSWQQAPHFVQLIDVEATAIKQVLAKAKAAGQAITLNDLLIEACALAVQAEPSINAHISGTKLITHNNIVISLAVDTTRGLRTPKIAVADISLEIIAQQRAETIAAIQDGKPLSGQDSPAVVTISNLGKFGIRAGTPVLNLDEPVLVFAGGMEDRVVAIDGAVVVRPYMTLSIAYDHRLVDGMQAARFTSAIKTRLENRGADQ